MRGIRFPAAAVLLLAAAAAAHAADAGCLLCHDFPLSSGGRSLQVAGDAKGTAHGTVPCRSCHSWVTVIPHGVPSPAADCASRCHAAPARELAASAHREGTPGWVSCRGCHRSDGAKPDASPVGDMGWCLPCHARGARWEGYLRSPHARGLAAGEAAAGCPDCHTAHGALPGVNPASSVGARRLPETCRGAVAPGRQCHPGAADAFSGIPAGHASVDEAALRRLPGARILLGAAALLIVLLAGINLLPPSRGGA